MPTWHRLGAREELSARVPFAIKLDRQQMAVFLHEGRFRAIGNRCNHQGGPLSEGQVRGEFVMCPWHGWRYDVRDGTTDHPDADVRVYPVAVKAGEVFITILSLIHI